MKSINVNSQDEMLALKNVVPGDIVMRNDLGRAFILREEPASILENWVKIIFPAQVNTINDETGIVYLTTKTVQEEENLYYTEDRATENFYKNLKNVNLGDIVDNENGPAEETVELIIDCGYA